MYSGNGGKKINNKIRHKILSGFMALLAGMTIVCAVYSFCSNNKKWETSRIQFVPIQYFQEQMKRTYMPVFAFIEDETGSFASPDYLYQAVLNQIPIYKYCEEQAGERIDTEDETTRDMLIRQEGSDEERKDIGDTSLEYEKDALHIDADLKKAMEEENGLHNNKNAEEEKKNKIDSEQMEKTKEKEEIETPNSEFQKADHKSYQYNWSEIKEYDDIVSAFYAIDKTTSITDKQLNMENLTKDMTIKKNADNPQILIYHTHSQEAFADSIPGDPATTIVGAGERLANILRDQYGYNVIHHTGEYDVENRDYAYSNALPAIERVLAENSTIEVVIDLHRDAVDEGRKLVIDVQGRPTAQFMFFNGLSRSRQKGDISYLENPYVNDNLAFSFQAQVACNEYYPGIARRIYLKAYRYNMHLREKSMLVELGAQTNTVEEIMNACDPLAHVIAKVLSGETADEVKAALTAGQ